MHASPLPPPIWVENHQAMKTMLVDLLSQPLVAVDTESNSLYAYKEQVCLIQFSTPDRDYLVDPLALIDLSALGEVFADEKIEKIFHAAEYDIICLKRDYHYCFRNIFDTMHASRTLGRSEIGLADLLSTRYGLIVEKRLQRANWGMRPLSSEMLYYARLDTHYLIDLRNQLRKELIDNGLLELAEEDFFRLTQANIPNGENDNLSCWRMIGRNTLPSAQCAVLQALIEYRDAQARKANLPHFKILSNQALIEIAQASPTNVADLDNIASLSKRQSSRHAYGLLQAVNQGLNNRPPARPASRRPDDGILARIDTLKKWRKVTARGLQVESDIVLPRDIAEQIAYANPTSLDQLQALMKTTPWRFQRYGEQILEILMNGH